MRRLALFALIPLTLALAQDDAERQRSAKLRALEDWVGKWEAELVLNAGPPEIKGLKIRGEVAVKWDLDHTALRFDGWGKAAQGDGKRLVISGLLTFNHVGPYEERKYSAVFASSADARLLLAKGEFQGKDLLMKVGIHPSGDGEFDVRVVGKNPRRVIVRLSGPQSAKHTEWMRITLKRK